MKKLIILILTILLFLGTFTSCKISQNEPSDDDAVGDTTPGEGDETTVLCSADYLQATQLFIWTICRLRFLNNLKLNLTVV